MARVTLMRSVETRVGRMAPKKSVMGTLCGSRRYRSLRTPTVEMHTRLGHTWSCRGSRGAGKSLLKNSGSLNSIENTYKLANSALAEGLHLLEELQGIVSVAINHVHAN